MNVVNTKISDYIRGYKEKGVSMSSIAKKTDISPQCLNGWLKKPDTYWGLDALMLLSEKLEFEVSIKNGELNIIKGELNEMKEKEILNTKKVINYEVYKDFGKYAVVYLYTPTSNLNYDEEVELLEDNFFIYPSEEECIENNPKDKPIRIYGLLDKNANELYDSRCSSIYPYEAEGYYYFNKAKVIEKTSDGYDVVYIFEDSKLKLVKAGAILEFFGDESYKITGYTSDMSDNGGIPGFALMPMDGKTSDDFILWGSNMGYLYAYEISLLDNVIGPRHFDRNRNEIKTGDILVKKGLPWDADYIQEEIDENPRMNAEFEIGETIKVKEQSLFYFEGSRYFLNNLHLMEWEILNNKEGH